ncbi:sensor domain-containing diguanylate cyclase [Massilia horti]|uniref:Diguanylate cyclase n=1 Tax=Massilia horti TaxID=2562153 RepID=A0A4Y9T4Q1_9BURK|nr:sensor domain-containing diguanylate cyclase [Massilia horti]TFW34657.1 diguanylate cyclase [Massilia horti]
MRHETAPIEPRVSSQSFGLATLVKSGICAAVGLTVLLQFFLVEHFNLNSAETQARLQLLQLSWQMRDSLNRVIARTIGEVRLMSELDQVRQARRPEDVRPVLKSLQNSFPDYAWIGIAGPDGKVFAATDGLLEQVDVSMRPWFSQGMKGLHTSDYHPAVLLGNLLKSSSPEPLRFVDVAGPIKDENGIVRGVLTVHLSWDWARRRARNLLVPALREYGAELLVVRDDGVVVLGPEPMLEKKLATESLSRAQRGETGSTRETWPDGKVYLTGYTQTGLDGESPALRWSVLVRQPEEVAMAGPHALGRWMLVASVLLGIALAAIGALLVRRYLTGPILMLSGAIETAVQDGAGVRGKEIPLVDGFHEAQVLSHALRDLVQREDEQRRALEAMNEQLESTVAERTAELRKLLMHDGLTGLPNRRALMQALPEAMRRADRLGKPCAVIFLDMDGFKTVNDTYGHEEGDELLRQFGARIAQAVRKTDMVARLAGDEFVAILELLADRADAEEKAHRLLPVLREPYVLKTATVVVGASIGVAVHQPGNARDLDALLSRADHAMYAAKRAGKNRLVVDSA